MHKLNCGRIVSRKNCIWCKLVISLIWKLVDMLDGCSYSPDRWCWLSRKGFLVWDGKIIHGSWDHVRPWWRPAVEKGKKALWGCMCRLLSFVPKLMRSYLEFNLTTAFWGIHRAYKMLRMYLSWSLCWSLDRKTTIQLWVGWGMRHFKIVDIRSVLANASLFFKVGIAVLVGFGFGWLDLDLRAACNAILPGMMRNWSGRMDGMFQGEETFSAQHPPRLPWWWLW